MYNQINPQLAFMQIFYHKMDKAPNYQCL